MIDIQCTFDSPGVKYRVPPPPLREQNYGTKSFCEGNFWHYAVQILAFYKCLYKFDYLTTLMDLKYSINETTMYFGRVRERRAKIQIR